MKQPETCLYPNGHPECPFLKSNCIGCGWDEEEAKRRKKLPLMYDEIIEKRRKVISGNYGKVNI